MSYHITVDYRPEGKYPFALNTEADQIPLTREELESLKHAIDVALMAVYNAKEIRKHYIILKEIRNECTA